MDTHCAEHLGAYGNLGAFLRYRNQELVSEPLRPTHLGSDAAGAMTPQKVVGDIILQVGYWEVVARSKTEPAQLMVIYLITADSKAAHSTQDLRKLLVTAVQKDSPDSLGEVIILAPESVTQKKNLQEEIRTYGASARKGGRNVYYNMYPYCKFASVVPEMPIVPRHEVLSKDEGQAILDKFFLTRAQLPRIIAAEDPAAIWCGARPGDFVRVWRTSETAVSRVPTLRLAV